MYLYLRITRGNGSHMMRRDTQRAIWWGERDSREMQMVLRDTQWREKDSREKIMVLRDITW